MFAWVMIPSPGFHQPVMSLWRLRVVVEDPDRDVPLEEVLGVAEDVDVALLHRLERDRVDVAGTDEVVLVVLAGDRRGNDTASWSPGAM